MKKPSLVAIFAHPDDEAFGPAGTLALYSKTHDVSLICVTRGQSGENHHNGDLVNIATIREQELRASAKVLGIKNVFFLEFIDGHLSNHLYHDIAEAIREILEGIKPEILMTFEGSGISGHLDHIAVTMITQYIFDRVEYAKTLMLFTILKEESDGIADYFIYVPEGLQKSQVDKIVDITQVADIKTKALMEHKSQIKDIRRVLEQRKTLPKEEYFLIKKK